MSTSWQQTIRVLLYRHYTLPATGWWVGRTSSCELVACWFLSSISRARRLQDSHVLQVAAQCLLVEEVYGVRPTHGLVVLAGGMQERVEFTPALEERLLDTMAEMRALLCTDAEPGPHWVAHKCHACGFREACWDGAR